MTRSLHLACLLALLVGCPQPEEAGPARLADDDDSAYLDDDDDDASLERSGVVWLQERQELHTNAATVDRVLAVASFSGQPLASMGRYADHSDLGLPLPGLLLHPELAPEFEGGEGCLPIAHDEDWAALPGSVEVGDKVHLESPGGAGLDLVMEDELYRLAGAGPLTASSWALELEGGPDWPPSETGAVIELPEQVSLHNTGTGPGSMSSFEDIRVAWVAGDEDSLVEITLVRFLSAEDRSSWTGVWCLSPDDGEVYLDAPALPNAGNGPVHVSIARARWVVEPGDPAENRPALHIGAIRGVTFEKTVSGG